MHYHTGREVSFRRLLDDTLMHTILYYIPFYGNNNVQL